MTRYAEQANYFDTTVHPARSQGEIVELLENFGADQIMIMQGQAGGKYAWVVRFQWLGRTYRFVFTPLECHYPTQERSFSGKRRTMAEQARYQMGRIAVYMVKAVLTAAEAQPAALFGFLELPATVGGNGTIPPTAAEIDVANLILTGGLLSDIPKLIEGEVVEEE